MAKVSTKVAQANKKVVITLDKERSIRFTLNSFRLLEKEFGIKIENLGDSINMETIQALLYVGLRHEDKSLTFEEVGDLVDFGNMAEVNEKLSEAFLVHQS